VIRLKSCSHCRVLFGIPENTVFEYYTVSTG
jgi:hypothetical protein